MARLPKVNLLVKVLVAIVLGIALGSFMPGFVVRAFITFNRSSRSTRSSATSWASSSRC